MSGPHTPLLVWAMTTGEAGMRSQARGLAMALSDRVIEKTWRGRGARGWLAGNLGPGFGPPWPDVLVACGRRSIAPARWIRRAAAGRCLTVYIQDPRGSEAAFDLIVAMAHDKIAAGPRVLKVETALHEVTPDALARAAEMWRPRLGGLGRPLVGVAIGGSTGSRRFTDRHAETLVEVLRAVRRGGGSLAITPSRRTPAAVRARLLAAFAGDPAVFVWDGAGQNPYLGILALADRLVVTSDSVSMISEALATAAPVQVFDLGFGRHDRFLDGLVASGLVSRFADPPPTRGRVDVTGLAAAAVVRMVQARTGLAGQASCSRASQSPVT
ncbi:MAG: mitochondrial fission ELM1 family protein [Caulobacteraceae bacterium]